MVCVQCQPKGLRPLVRHRPNPGRGAINGRRTNHTGGIYFRVQIADAICPICRAAHDNLPKPSVIGNCLDGVVVSIPDCQSGDPGSNPGRGVSLLLATRPFRAAPEIPPNAAAFDGPGRGAFVFIGKTCNYLSTLKLGRRSSRPTHGRGRPTFPILRPLERQMVLFNTLGLR